MKTTLLPMQGAPGTLRGVKRPGSEFEQFYLAPRISKTGAIFPFCFMLHMACERTNFHFFISSLVNKL